MNLSPAQWIWYPSERTLPNTFVLLRREIKLSSPPIKASGWIAADSRYRLTVNGNRIQWGPAPADPRWPDADPLDLAAHLQEGTNVIGVEVLYYGYGDGTWVTGKPGLLFLLEIEEQKGSHHQIISDGTWASCVDRAHPPGMYKRWYLRALQEEFDARLHPQSWDCPGYSADREWLPAMILDGPADKPTLCTGYNDYLTDCGATHPEEMHINARSIPLLQESIQSPIGLAEQGRVNWLRDPKDWFEFRTPGSFKIHSDTVAKPIDAGVYELEPLEDHTDGLFLTFEMEEQMVGWPRFSIEASEGTIVELITQESHELGKNLWLDSHRFTWSRFICRDGLNAFESFDFESLRWLQLHIRNARGTATIRQVGLRRRIYPFPNTPTVQCSDTGLQRLFDACLNTIQNGAQETIVDGMGRERQQYSGDIGHELHGIRYAFGEVLLPERYLRTYSEGLTLEGYFLDCWPAYDRMVRIPQREMGLTMWGPILDHGVQFSFDNWYHYMETGRIEALRAPYPRLKIFAETLWRSRDAQGLLPVENLGVPWVWIDHDAYAAQRHKQCAYNLHAAAMYTHALAPIARLFGEANQAAAYEQQGETLLNCTIARFWDTDRSIFINNLPWLQDENDLRLCDRSLATAILFDQCPNGQTAPSLEALANCPPEMGLSYPPNTGWRYQALIKLGRTDVVLKDFRTRWITLASVVHNNTLQEGWHARPDSSDQWSHASVAPLYVLFMDIAGIRPAAPGFAKCTIRPQLADLGSLSLTAYTVQGPIHFEAIEESHGHRYRIHLPEGCTGELLLENRTLPLYSGLNTV